MPIAEPKRRIRALVLDFDGVILDTESALIGAAAEVHRAHGVPFDPDTLLHGAGTVFAFDPWAAFPPEVPRRRLRAEHELACAAAFARLPLLPGVERWLDEAARLGLALGIASNSTNAYIGDHLSRLGLRGKFHVVTGRDSVVHPKPAPDVYLRTVERLGVRPEEAIAVEDSFTGATSARRAGLHVIGVPGPSTTGHDLSAAHHRVRSLAELSVSDAIARFLG